MANDQQSGLAGLAGNGLLWLLVAAIGAASAAFLNQRAPLQDYRPATKTLISTPYSGEQFVDVRLWEDPFAAVGKARSKHDDGKKPNADAVSTIVVVTVPGAAYAEEAETRRRTRYAVIAALNAERYVPNDEAHIGYFVDKQLTSSSSAIPFEKFEKPPGKGALVLWIDEDALQYSNHPIAVLSDIICDLRVKAGTKVKVIGPSDGETVRVMVSETGKPIQGSCANSLAQVSFYAYGVTIDDGIILRGQGVTDPPTLEEYFDTKHILYQRTIASDAALAQALSGELRLRGVQTLDDIAVVTEWDTYYGQNFPATFECAFAQETTPPCRQQTDHRYSYLRGLDGQLPGTALSGSASQDAVGDGSDKDSKDAKSATGGDLREPADGDGQFDYLRRLADRMRREAQGIKAIGVLGSDIYDKLLVLRALRSNFPDAIFFTTDLDARLLDPQQAQYTRNLLVASGYDLQLHDGDVRGGQTQHVNDIQEDVPPFRDSYQSAAFLSARWALHDDTDQPVRRKLDDAIVDCQTYPPVFEVGRGRVFSLERDGQSPRSACAPDRPFPELRGRHFLGACFIIAIILGGIAVSFPGVRAYIGRRPWSGIGAVAIGALGVSLLLCWLWPDIARVLTNDGRDQPVVWFEGISLWPVIFLRCVSILLAVGLIFHMIHALNKNSRELGRKFRFSVRLDNIRSQRWKFRDAFSLRFIPMGDAHPTGTEIDRFWRKYVMLGRTRALRVLVYVAAMFITWFAIACMFGMPSVPSRGPISRSVYSLSTLLDVIATWFAIFLVVDATVIGFLLAAELQKFRTIWPDDTKARFRESMGLDAKFLDDWIDIKFISKRTQCIVGLIYWPFGLIALLILSRSAHFAAFGYDKTLMVGWGLSVTILVICVLMLRWQAEQARRIAYANVNNQLMRMRGSGSPDEARLEMLLSRISVLNDGAFAPVSQQPVVKALLLPLGTFGGSELLQYFLQNAAT